MAQVLVVEMTERMSKEIFRRKCVECGRTEEQHSFKDMIGCLVRAGYIYDEGKEKDLSRSDDDWC